MSKIVITEMFVKNRKMLVSGLLSDGNLVEVRCEDTESEQLLGNIYVGKVQKVVENINAAFIEIAPGFACYYPIRKKEEPIYTNRRSAKGLCQGDEVIVQIMQESVKTKAPTVSCNLTLNGRYTVVTAGDKKIGISRKLDAQTRERFRAMIDSMSELPYGVIIRTNAAQVEDELILSELTDLIAKMNEIIANGRMRTCFSCLHKEQPKYMTFIRNCHSQRLDEIVTDLPDIYEQLNAYCKEYEELKDLPIRLYKDPLLPISALYNLERQMLRATEKNVWLKSGAYLVIEPTEAMTVIDVNSGKSVAKKSVQEHFIKVNIEAAEEIAKQIRLRNISGIIVVDFIDLKAKADREQLLEVLRREVSFDPIPVQVVDMTMLNLVEMTRKKSEKSLLEQINSVSE